MSEVFDRFLVVILLLLVLALSIVGLFEYSSKGEWKALAGSYEFTGQLLLDKLNDKESMINELSLCLDHPDYVTSYTVVNKSITDIRCRMVGLND